MNVYLASSYSDKERMSALAHEVFDKIDGVRVVSTWHEQTIDEMDFHALGIQAYAVKGLEEIDRCDVLVLFTKEGGASISSGRHVEYGYAYARGKRIVAVGDYENLFQTLCTTLVADHVGAVIDLVNWDGGIVF